MSDFDWIDDLDQPFIEDDLETTRQLSRPKTHARRVAKRQFVSGLKKEALTELIPELPPSDVDLYVVGNGSGAEIRGGVNPQAFDFGSFLPYIVEMLGNRDCVAYVSTWTMNRQHAQAMIQMLDDGRLQALTVATDPYFKRREASVCNELIAGLQRNGQRFLAWKNHVKCIAIRNQDARFVTITGSANLSAQPRCEQYVVTTDPGVYHFFVSEFFEEMMSR